jgi:endonuclease G
VIVKPGGKLSATAYLLSQKDLIKDLEEAFTYGAYRMYQV